MANHPSQQQLTGWNQPDDEVMDHVSFPLDYYDFNVQQNIQPPTMFEEFSDTSPAQFQGMGTSHTIGNQLEGFPDTGIYPAMYQNPACFPENAPPPPIPINYSLGAGIPGLASGMGFDFTAPQVPYSEMCHNYSRQDLPLGGSSLESHGPGIGGHFGMEQSQLNHLPTLSPDLEDMQDATNIHSGFSQFQGLTYGDAFTASQIGCLPRPELSPAQLSSNSYSYPFGESSTELSGLDYSIDLEAQIYKEPIFEDTGAKWGSFSQPANSSTGITFNEFGNEMGSFENPIEITETPKDNNDSQPSSSTLDRTNRAVKPFGPSRPVSLPPARRGGRKGPLSKAELENRRQAKEQGVCIRCSMTKQKCYGGFPCKLCIENSKAVLWKFPCTKAQFLDLVDYGSYFENVEEFQRYAIEKLNNELFDLGIELIQGLYEFGFFTSDIATDNLRHIQGPLSGSFRRGLEVFKDILERASRNKSTPYRQMIETPYRLGNSKSCIPPISIDELGFKKPIDRLEQMITFCNSKRIETLRATNDGVLDGFSTDCLSRVMKYILNILMWLSQRYYEIIIFRSVQDAANRLSSLSTDELSKIIIVLLDLLTRDLSKYCMSDNGLMYTNIASGTVYVDNQKRIRQALFIYLAIALDKLPTFYNFWQSMGKSYHRTFPDISKHRITDLESFNWYSKCEIERAKLHMALRFPESTDVNVIKRPPSEEPFKPSIANADPEVYLSTLFEIYYGCRNDRVELEAIYKRLTTFYQPIFKLLEEMFKSLDDRVPPRHLKILRRVRHTIEIMVSNRLSLERELEIQLRSGKRKGECSNVKGLIESSLGFIAGVNISFKMLLLIVERLLIILQHDSTCF